MGAWLWAGFLFLFFRPAVQARGVTSAGFQMALRRDASSRELLVMSVLVIYRQR